MTKRVPIFPIPVDMLKVGNSHTKLLDRTKNLVNNSGGPFVELLSPAD